MPDKLIDPESFIRLSIVRLILAERFDDCEIVRCLDTKTGETCDVAFLPAMDMQTGKVYMTPAFPVPEAKMEKQEARYLPVEDLPKTNEQNYKNN